MAQIDRGETSGAPSELRSTACQRFRETVAETTPELVPIPGTGACVCPNSPERVRQMAELWHETFDTVKLNIILDHRCAHHGERAQPTLWGRHKEKELVVTAAQWNSLGVTYTEPQP